MPRNRSPAARSCAGWAPRWRCRCSTPWCRRCRRWRRRRPAGVRRLGFIYLPNGVAMNFKGVNYWKPKAKAPTSSCRRSSRRSTAFRDQMIVVSGTQRSIRPTCSNDGANGDHTRGTSTWLTGVHPKHTEGADVQQRDLRRPDRGATSSARTRALPSLELRLDLELPGRQLRERLQLRLHEHAVVELADDAAADREQSARRVRAAVRRRRHVSAAACPGAQRTRAFWTR